MKKKLLIILGAFLGLLVILGALFYIETRPVSLESEDVYFTVNTGDNKLEILSNLKDAGLIKSKYFTLLYVLVQPGINLQAGTYKIYKASSSLQIIDQIASGDTKILADTIKVTFPEGLTIVDYSEIIEKAMGISKEDFLKTVNDKSFINKMKAKYSFLSYKIDNDKIYYPLEGYLFGETYEFYKDATSENIIDKMLQQTGKKLDSINDDIKTSSYDVHEILTMASIIEMEASKEPYRSEVSQVIYKRLSINMALGMDVTTYYGAQVKRGENISKHLNDVNGYNTRNINFKGLPVGPISNPSLESIKAALHPADTDYLYFAADIKTQEVFFAKTET